MKEMCLTGTLTTVRLADMNTNNRPNTITNNNGKTMWIRPDGMGYESSKGRRERMASEAARKARTR